MYGVHHMLTYLTTKSYTAKVGFQTQIHTKGWNQSYSKKIKECNSTLNVMDVHVLKPRSMQIRTQQKKNVIIPLMFETD